MKYLPRDLILPWWPSLCAMWEIVFLCWQNSRTMASKQETFQMQVSPSIMSIGFGRNQDIVIKCLLISRLWDISRRLHFINLVEMLFVCPGLINSCRKLINFVWENKPVQIENKLHFFGIYTENKVLLPGWKMWMKTQGKWTTQSGLEMQL